MVKRTYLYDFHKRMGAKFTEFSGFEVPLYYTSIVEEHLAVRKSVGLFDVSHMSKVIVEGERRKETISRVTTANADILKPGRAKYSAALDYDGHIMDDFVFMVSEDRYFIVPNAGNGEKITRWIEKNGYSRVKNCTSDYLIFAVQGPFAQKTLQKLCDFDLSEIKRFRFKETEIDGIPLTISRTGYTGEDGFEIFPKIENYGKDLILQIYEAGREFGIKLCGVGARDSLRLEKGMALSGHELANRNPLEANLEWIINWDHDFIGKDKLDKAKVKEFCVPIILEEKGIPRHGCLIKKDGKEIGKVTSGGISPVLNRGISLGYVEREYAKEGEEVTVDVRGRGLKGRVTKVPFV